MALPDILGCPMIQKVALRVQNADFFFQGVECFELSNVQVKLLQ